jgi:hypothetical protein
MAKGLPLRAPRTVRMGGVKLTAIFDGETVVLRDYLETYQDGQGGFRPFLVQTSGGPFVTAPEDGSSIVLREGDRLVLGQEVIRVAIR